MSGEQYGQVLRLLLFSHRLYHTIVLLVSAM